MPDNVTSGLFSSPADFFAVEVWRGASLNEETVSGPSSVFSLALRSDYTATSSLVSIDKSNASYTSTFVPRDRLDLTSGVTENALWPTVLSPSSPSRAPLYLLVITISRIYGVIVFAVGAYEGKTDMNGKSEWVNQGECIRITTATGFFTVRGRGGAVTEREKERQDRATGSETGQPRYTRHGVFTNCLISSTNRCQACFSCPRGAPLSYLARVYWCIHVARFSRTTALKESSEIHKTFVASRVLIFRLAPDYAQIIRE